MYLLLDIFVEKANKIFHKTHLKRRVSTKWKKEENIVRLNRKKGKIKTSKRISVSIDDNTKWIFFSSQFHTVQFDLRDGITGEIKKAHEDVYAELLLWYLFDLLEWIFSYTYTNFFFILVVVALLLSVLSNFCCLTWYFWVFYWIYVCIQYRILRIDWINL